MTISCRAARRLSRSGRHDRRARPAGAVAGVDHLRAPRRAGHRPGGPARRPRRRLRGAGGDRVAELGAACWSACSGCPALGPGDRADQLPAQRRGGRPTSSGTAAPRCCMVDPELDEPWAACRRAHRFVLGVRRRRAVPRGRGAGAVASPTRTPSAPSTTRRAPPPDRRECSSATGPCGSTPPSSGGPTGVSDRDVYLHTLPMFHCNGWGMPFTTTAMGVPQVVLRKVDGAEILRRVDRARGDPDVRCPGRRGRHPGGGVGWDGPVPGSGTHPDRRRRRPAPDPDHRAGGDRAGLGVHPDLRPHRDGSAAHHQPRPGGVGRVSRLRSGRSGWAGPGCRRSASRSPWTMPARCWPGPTTCSTATGSSPRRPTPPSSTAGSTPATAGGSTTGRTWRSPTARRT